mmetsp:Transcript_824/g.2815  ORF Transcript_824/g.2815 Transcript_824/m.2815 type:complete len:249 (+) Transcript_824:286-1032(+)
MQWCQGCSVQVQDQAGGGGPRGGDSTDFPVHIVRHLLRRLRVRRLDAQATVGPEAGTKVHAGSGSSLLASSAAASTPFRAGDGGRHVRSGGQREQQHRSAGRRPDGTHPSGLEPFGACDEQEPRQDNGSVRHPLRGHAVRGHRHLDLEGHGGPKWRHLQQLQLVHGSRGHHHLCRAAFVHGCESGHESESLRGPLQALLALPGRLPEDGAGRADCRPRGHHLGHPPHDQPLGQVQHMLSASRVMCQLP